MNADLDRKVNPVIDRLESLARQGADKAPRHNGYDRAMDELFELTNTNRKMLSLSDATLARMEGWLTP